MQLSRLMPMAAAAMAAPSGCSVLDDDVPPPVDVNTASDTGDGERSCVADAVESIGAACPAPRQWWVDHTGGTSKAVAIDDPEAWIGVGPGAWLVQLNSSADFVGTYIHVAEDCDPACGWCLAGQHACHAGVDENGNPLCVACIPFDEPNWGATCVDFVEACLHGGEGLDETGDGTTEGVMEYDCSTWHPEDGVQHARDGAITVDAALIDDALFHQGEPLATCDGARFRRRPDGFFEISRLAGTGLLASMGMEVGDAIMAVDGKPMNSFDAVIQAMSMLGDSASFTATITRGDGRFEMHVIVR